MGIHVISKYKSITDGLGDKHQITRTLFIQTIIIANMVLPKLLFVAYNRWMFALNMYWIKGTVFLHVYFWTKYWYICLNMKHFIIRKSLTSYSQIVIDLFDAFEWIRNNKKHKNKSICFLPKIRKNKSTQKFPDLRYYICTTTDLDLTFCVSSVCT